MVLIVDTNKRTMKGFCKAKDIKKGKMRKDFEDLDEYKRLREDGLC